MLQNNAFNALTYSTDKFRLYSNHMKWEKGEKSLLFSLSWFFLLILSAPHSYSGSMVYDATGHKILQSILYFFLFSTNLRGFVFRLRCFQAANNQFRSDVMLRFYCMWWVLINNFMNQTAKPHRVHILFVSASFIFACTNMIQILVWERTYKTDWSSLCFSGGCDFLDFINNSMYLRVCVCLSFCLFVCLYKQWTHINLCCMKITNHRYWAYFDMSLEMEARISKLYKKSSKI